MTTPNGTLFNGNGKRWYDEHTKLVAATMIISTLIILSPVFAWVYARTSTNERALSDHKLEAQITQAQICSTLNEIKVEVRYLSEMFKEHRSETE